MATSTFKRGFTLKGSEDLIKFLGNFAPEIENKMLDASVRSAANIGIAKPIKTNIKQLFKQHTGNLLKGVKVGKVKGAPPGNMRVYMGPPAYHAHFFEFGTVASRAIKGKNTKGWTVKLQYNKAGDLYRVKTLAVFLNLYMQLAGLSGLLFLFLGMRIINKKRRMN